MSSRSIEESLLELTGDLIRIPSRAGIDSYAGVFECIAKWLNPRGIQTELLFERNVPVAVTATIGQHTKGPTYLLIATADTAEFGDESAWTQTPVSPVLRDGWLYGRGSADSKAGVAIFCHVAAALLSEMDQLGGAVTLIFDADEHSGSFSGIKRSLEVLGERSNIAGAMVGYPGQDKIVIGCRGFLRAGIRVHGKSAHSGSSSKFGMNAISRAADLVRRLQCAPLPQETTPAFPLPPRLSVISIHGGAGDSSIPDLCTLRVDMRLTPQFDGPAAERFLRDIVHCFDQPECAAPTELLFEPGWPAYVVPPDNPMVQALADSVRQVLNKDLPRKVAGPSSVGNLLAERGIPATAGFGVVFSNAHATDECFRVDSLVPAYLTYLATVRKLLRIEHPNASS